MSTKNDFHSSGLKAVGHAVLCKPYEQEIGKIELPDFVKERELMGEMRGVVLQVGGDCWTESEPRAEPGDHVLISKFCGAIVKGPADGKFYRLCNDDDVFCQIDPKLSMDNVVIENPIAKTKRVARGA